MHHIFCIILAPRKCVSIPSNFSFSVFCNSKQFSALPNSFSACFSSFFSHGFGTPGHHFSASFHNTIFLRFGTLAPSIFIHLQSLHTTSYTLPRHCKHYFCNSTLQCTTVCTYFSSTFRLSQSAQTTINTTIIFEPSSLTLVKLIQSSPQNHSLSQFLFHFFLQFLRASL